MKTLEQKISVMQAALDGKEIDCIIVNNKDDVWETIRNKDNITWNWLGEDYRIKTEPMEFWVDVWDNGHFCIHNDIETTPPGFRTIKVREVLDEAKS